MCIWDLDHTIKWCSQYQCMRESETWVWVRAYSEAAILSTTPSCLTLPSQMRHCHVISIDFYVKGRAFVVGYSAIV